MSAATSELPEQFGDALRRGDLVALHRTLHALPDDTLRAAAAALPPAEASLLMSAACLPPEKVALAISALAGGATCSAEGSYGSALAVVHEVLLELPADARDALQARLPAAARPLVDLAADLDAHEFGEARRSPLRLTRAYECRLTRVLLSSRPPAASWRRSILSTLERVSDLRKGDLGARSADPRPPRDATGEAVGGVAGVRHLEGRVLATVGVVARAQLRRQQRWAAETYQSSGAAHPRLAGLCISAAACVLSVLSCLLSLLTLRLAHAYIAAFAGALAALLALLEADGATCASLARPLLRRSPCLRPPSGRARAYALLSLLCLSSWPHPTSLLALAALLPAAGYARAHARAAPPLRQLRAALADAGGVRAAFESSSAALGGARLLRGAQLARLVPALDAADMLAVHGVETALSPLGGHGVTLASALEWWAAVDAAHAPRPLSLADGTPVGVHATALSRDSDHASAHMIDTTPFLATPHHATPLHRHQHPIRTPPHPTPTAHPLPAADERAFSAPNRADPHMAAGNETPAPACQQLLLVWQRYWPRYPSVAALLLGGALSLCAALLELLDVAAAAVGGVWPPTLSPCLAAAAAVLCGATLAVDGAQLPSPLGPKLRAVALPLLRAWPPLSLGVVRSLLALLALALLAVEEGWRGESSYAAGFVELLALLPLLFACVAARRIPAALLTLDAAAMVPLPCSDVKEAVPSHPFDWRGSLSSSALAEIVALDATEVGDALVTLDLDRDGRVSDEDLLAWAGLHAPAGGSSP
ncbi:hypothetical protein AB1Y20_000598 [Prymnesium parvum]|uniref:EF-hand domain-containing protein n=1 Tax=Prymnesium parvum TaxID=97485 RepID=A0AB34K8H6_PRYPA